MLRRETQQDSDSGAGVFLAGCLAGLIAGGLLGLALAPHRGDITRRKVARKAEETKDHLMETVTNQMENLQAQKGIRDDDEERDS